MTPSIRLVLGSRVVEAGHALRQAIRHNRLQVVLVAGFLTLLFAGLTSLFRSLLQGLEGISATEFDRDLVLKMVLPIMFLSLFVMLAVSAGITSFVALFRPREGDPLVTWPVGDRELLIVRFVESFGFSAWAFLFLCGPLFIGWALVMKPSPAFIPLAVLAAIVFSLHAGSWGCLAAVLVGRFLPRRRKGILWLTGLVAAVFVVQVWFTARGLRQGGLMPGAVLGAVADRLSFATGTLSPSGWMTEAFLSASEGNLGRTLFLAGLLLSHALMALHISGMLLTGRLYQCIERTAPRLVKVRPGLLTRLLGPGVAGDHRRLLLWKDLLVFIRDPGQWMQLLLFFGLLGAYFLNLRRYESMGELVHRNFVAFVNLAALLLTLSTFTSRFVFPQMSLEGRRFWFLGLMPLPRRDLLMGKFWLSFAGCFAVAGFLSWLSCQRLNLGPAQTLCEILIAFSVSLGLTGLAIGLGIRLPDFRAVSAPKVVSGFGGTVQLAVAAAFLVLELSLAYLPVFTVRTISDLGAPRVLLCFLLCLAVGAATAAISLRLGLRHFEKMEF
ncbi:MAG: hypothetical protein AB7F75_11260 [Planctomycetota bacterium]